MQCTIQNTKKGFTLIELMMTIVIIGILASIGIPVAFKLFQSFQYTLYRKDLSEQAEVALRRLDREMRRLKNKTSLVTANAALYRYVDINDKTIQFQLNGTDLEREYDGQTDILASNVTSFAFSYLDDEGNVIAAPRAAGQPTDMRFVKIDLTFEENDNTLYYSIQIKPRNVPHISDML